MSSDATSKKGPEKLRFLSSLRSEPWKHDFFAAARRLEAGHDGPGFGDSVSPRHDPVRFGQSARMEFSPRAIGEFVTGNTAGGVPLMRLLFSGLFGANGPMPYHLTEYITDRRQHHGDTTVEAFADIFHHRFFSLLYRAWADTEPVVAQDRSVRGKPDVFATFMGAVAGTAYLDGGDFLETSRRYYMGQIGPSASRPESLERILADHTGEDVRVHEFQGRWLDIESGDRMRLGRSALGDGSVLGSEVWSRSAAFEIEVGPLDAEGYESFLPGGGQAALVHEIVTAVIGMELEWELRPVRAGETISGARLACDGEEGGAALGWASWMGDGDVSTPRGDLALADRRYKSARQQTDRHETEVMAHG